MAGQNLAQVVSEALATMSLDLDLKGGAIWAPSRNPKKNYDKWGVWEVWEVFRIGHITPCLVGPIATGDWCAWHSASGQQMGFSRRIEKSAKWQAEMLAASQNQGRPTRVVHGSGLVETSPITLREAERLLGKIATEYDGACVPS